MLDVDDDGKTVVEPAVVRVGIATKTMPNPPGSPASDARRIAAEGEAALALSSLADRLELGIFEDSDQ
jgi:hypothetical protein